MAPQITLPGYGNFVRELGFSPEARHVYVSAETRSGLSGALYIASVATGQVIQARVTGLVVTFAQPSDGRTLWVATAADNGETALLPVNAVTGLPGRAEAYVPGQPVAIAL